VDLFTTVDDIWRASTVSDATTGAYSFFIGTAAEHYCVAYLDGAPDLAGTTVNTLTGQPI
jgi:hypothetical protein